MKIWLRRILALALISLGIALVFLPFNNTRSGSVEQEVVYLQKQRLLDPEKISAQYPGVEISEISGPKFNPDDYPSLWIIFNYLDQEWVNDTCEISVWNKFQESILQEKKDFRLVVFRETLINCSLKTNGENSEIAAFSYMGRYNTAIQELSNSNLKKFPSIIEAIRNINFGKESESELTPIPISEWYKMVDRYLNPMEDYQTFKFDGLFYGPKFAWDIETKEGTYVNLPITLKIIGALLLFLGLFIIRKLYFRKKEIMVNPPIIAILWDIITLLLAIPSAWLLASLLLEKLLFIPPVYADDEIIFMGVFFFFFGIPFVSLYTSRLTSQSLVIDDLGIQLKGISEMDHLSWDEIESIDFSDEYVAVSRVGFLIPRKLQKRLRIRSRSGDSLFLNEPQLQSVKKKIRKQFQIFAPDIIRDKFLSVLIKW